MAERMSIEARAAAVEGYLDELTRPETLEFESAETRRVVGVIASKVRALLTGEPWVDPDAPSDRTRALIERLQRQ